MNRFEIAVELDSLVMLDNIGLCVCQEELDAFKEFLACKDALRTAEIAFVEAEKRASGILMDEYKRLLAERNE